MDFRKSTIFLFDIDGTLTTGSAQTIDPDLYKWLLNLTKIVSVGLVGGSHLAQITRQLGHNVLEDLDYVFPENGNLGYKGTHLMGKNSIVKFLGEEKLQTFLNFVMEYLSGLQLPCKRGNFVDFRTSVINISPVGRNCSNEEALEFIQFDRVHKVREQCVKAIEARFPDSELRCAIAGDIGFDVFPIGWDKTMCLQYLPNFSNIHFFGDKTSPGGNDYELFIHPRTIGHTVIGALDTHSQANNVIAELINQP